MGGANMHTTNLRYRMAASLKMVNRLINTKFCIMNVLSQKIRF